MFKHLMNGSSLLAIALRDANNDGGADEKTKLREQIAKGNLPEADKVIPPVEEDKEEDEKEEDDEDEKLDADGNPIVEKTEEELTPEQKAAKEAEEKTAAKLARKNDRMQRRIDEATARAKNAETELAAFKNANPDVKLTEAEVEAKAQAIADKKLAEKELADVQAKFEAACDKLQKGARKFDAAFDDNVNDMAEQFGPIPSFMIGVLEDFENGDELLAYIAKEEEVAELLYSLKNRPAKMTKELVELSNKLIAAKKKPKKEISKVPDPVTPVKGARANGSTVITEADTKNMEVYTAKRRAQMEERRKQGR